MNFTKMCILTILLLSTISCKGSSSASVSFQPTGSPVKINVDATGRVSLSVANSISTPIGTVFINGSYGIDAIEKEQSKRVLIVRVNNKATIYEIEKGKDFSVNFSNDNTIYTQVKLDYKSNGNIILELETTSSSNKPFFVTRLISDHDLQGRSEWDLDIMRNEIYARHGRRFKRSDLQEYFDEQPWYKPMYSYQNFSENSLSSIERQNAEIIRSYQCRISSGKCS